MRQSNTYIIIFSAVMTIVVGGLLSLTSVALKPAQQKQIELDTKMQILSAVMNIDSVIRAGKKADVIDIYDKRITSLVVNINGEQVETDEDGNPIVAEKVSIEKNFKLAPEERLFPVFRYMSESDPDRVEAYILPLYGNGLWDRIWGFVAVESDIETVKGVSFAHRGETPGLGARITSADIQQRYKGKKIYDDAGKLVSVEMMKGEHGGGESSIEYYLEDPHKVDGMSGATITARGVNDMLENYLNYYQSYFDRVKNEGKIT